MTLLELIKLLRKRWQLLVVLPVVCGLITAIVSWGILPNTYTSSVSLYILQSSSSNALSSTELSASQQIANDMAVIVKSDRVIDAAADSLDMDNLDDYSVRIDSSTTNRVITISVDGTNPSAVAKVADEIASQTSDVAEEVMSLDAVNVIDEAKVPASPSGPKRLVYLFVSLLVGLFVAISLILLIDMIDTSIKSPEEAEELLGMPVLGRIPAVKDMG